MFQRAFLLYNGKAGNGKTEKYLKDVVPRALQNFGELTIIPSKEKGDIELIYREREADLMIVMGGDGTVHECINGLAVSSTPPPLVILPTGTCNDFARSLRVLFPLWKRVIFLRTAHGNECHSFKQITVAIQISSEWGSSQLHQKERTLS